MSMYTKFKLWLKGEERYPDNVSEPIIAIVKSIKNHSSKWGVRPCWYTSSLAYNFVIVKDKTTKLEFRVYLSGGSYDPDSHAFIEWATKSEQEFVGSAVRDLYNKRYERYARINKHKQDKVNKKVRDTWKEIYK